MQFLGMLWSADGEVQIHKSELLKSRDPKYFFKLDTKEHLGLIKPIVVDLD